MADKNWFTRQASRATGDVSALPKWLRDERNDQDHKDEPGSKQPASAPAETGKGSDHGTAPRLNLR